MSQKIIWQFDLSKNISAEYQQAVTVAPKKKKIIKGNLAFYQAVSRGITFTDEDQRQIWLIKTESREIENGAHDWQVMSDTNKILGFARTWRCLASLAPAH